MSKVQFQKKYISFGLTTSLSLITLGIAITACTDQAKAKLNLIFQDPPKPGLAAKIGDEEISEEMLIGEDKLDFLDLKTREFELKKERLKKLATEKLIGAEAKKAGMTLPEFIEKKVVGGQIKISDADYKKFVAEKRIQESQINEQIKERIMTYLKESKKQDLVDSYLSKLTKGKPIVAYFRKPKMQVNVEVGNAPVFGKENAPVTIIEFSDFQCPFCSRGAETVNQVKKKYGGKVRIAFKHFPLPMHKDAKPAAEGSMCVNEQGSDKFWKFHDFAFKNQDKLDSSSLQKYAKDAGADMKKYDECVASKKFAEAVQKDLEYGEKIGVKSTPTFFVNGEIISGAVPIEAFSEKIDEALEEKK